MIKLYFIAGLCFTQLAVWVYTNSGWQGQLAGFSMYAAVVFGVWLGRRFAIKKGVV